MVKAAAKEKKVKDPNAPKRPQSSYMIVRPSVPLPRRLFVPASSDHHPAPQTAPSSPRMAEHTQFVNDARGWIKEVRGPLSLSPFNPLPVSLGGFEPQQCP